MPQHLFVYGTLRKRSEHPFAQRLRGEARFLGHGTAKGALYDFGWYPGAVFDPSHSGTVHGDLFALANPMRLIPLLDDYEGLAHQRSYGQYQRLTVDVTLHSGARHSAWSYALVSEPSSARRVRSGDWLHIRRTRPMKTL